jgi:hypothetical protein
MKTRSLIVVGDADERQLVAALLRLLRSRGWLAFYVRQVLSDFAAGRPPGPLAAVMDAKRAQARRRGATRGGAMGETR